MSISSTTAMINNSIIILNKSIPRISLISLHRTKKKFMNNFTRTTTTTTTSTSTPIHTHISQISTTKSMQLLASSSYNYGDVDVIDGTFDLPEKPPPEFTPPDIHEEEPTSIPIEIPTIPEVNPIPPPPGPPDFPDPGPPIPSPPVPDIPLPPPDILPPSTPPDITPPPRPPAPGDFPPPSTPPPDGFPPAGPPHINF